MKTIKLLCIGMLLVLAGCGDQKPSQKMVAFSQANNAEPYRATQKALMEKLFAATPDVAALVPYIAPVAFGSRVLRFTIEAMMKIDPAPEHVTFDTMLELNSGEYAVKGDDGAR